MIMVDTHVVVWLGLEQNKISQKARNAIAEARRAGAGLAISGATLLELAGLAEKKRIAVRMTPLALLEDVERQFTVLPITVRAAARAVELPANFPRDPIDRIIAGTALANGLSLVTADEAIRRSGAVPTIW
jgi:PIN domain nuclease of toxin-antitoxin system